uniref:Uncharacterized protein n=1 Tax=Oryza glumipatula TaxID=40148 RepID=A0A0D9Z0S3_9ORYZ
MGQMKCSGGGCVGSARRLRRSRSTATLVLRSGRSLPLISRHLSASLPSSTARSTTSASPMGALAVSSCSITMPSAYVSDFTDTCPLLWYSGSITASQPEPSSCTWYCYCHHYHLTPPHITNLAHQVAVQEDVLRLEVPVNDWVWLAAVEEHKGRGNLPGDAQPVTPRQRRRTAFAPQPLLQAAILHVLVHQAPPLHTRSQEHHQMRVMYLPQNLKLQN